MCISDHGCMYVFICIANPYEVIDHFTDFLLLYLNDDLLLLMYNHGLINKDEFDVVTSGPTRYHRNGLILEYVKQMDTASLLIFNEVLMESHPDITIPLMDGKFICLSYSVAVLKNLHFHTKQYQLKTSLAFFLMMAWQ